MSQWQWVEGRTLKAGSIAAVALALLLATVLNWTPWVEAINSLLRGFLVVTLFIMVMAKGQLFTYWQRMGMMAVAGGMLLSGANSYIHFMSTNSLLTGYTLLGWIVIVWETFGPKFWEAVRRDHAAKKREALL